MYNFSRVDPNSFHLEFENNTSLPRQGSAKVVFTNDDNEMVFCFADMKDTDSVRDFANAILDKLNIKDVLADIKILKYDVEKKNPPVPVTFDPETEYISNVFDCTTTMSIFTDAALPSMYKKARKQT